MSKRTPRKRSYSKSTHVCLADTRSPSWLSNNTHRTTQRTLSRVAAISSCSGSRRSRTSCSAGLLDRGAACAQQQQLVSEAAACLGRWLERCRRIARWGWAGLRAGDPGGQRCHCGVRQHDDDAKGSCSRTLAGCSDRTFIGYAGRRTAWFGPVVSADPTRVQPGGG